GSCGHRKSKDQNPRISTTEPFLSYAVCKGEQSTSEHLCNGEAENLMGWREANLGWSKLHQCPTLTLAALLEIFPKVRLPFPEYIARQPVHNCYQGSLSLQRRVDGLREQLGKLNNMIN
ncbi:hypothetical protein AVEN_139290-1, partial [Araneus ventricosus]